MEEEDRRERERRDENRRAYERGRKDSLTSQTLDAHEERLRVINGSITQQAMETAKLARAVAEISTGLARRDAVNEALAAAAVKATASTIGKRHLWFAVGTIILTIIGLFVGSGGIH